MPDASVLKLSNRAVPALNVTALVVGVGKHGGSIQVEGVGLPAALKHDIKALAPSLGLTGELGQVMRLPAGPDLKADVLVLTGLGARSDVQAEDGWTHYPAENLRQAVGAAMRNLAGTKSAAILLPSHDESALGVIVEGALLGNYAFHEHRGAASHKSEHNPVKRAVPLVEVVTRLSRSSWAQDAARRATILADAVNTVRDLVNTPPSHLFPDSFYEKTKSLVRATGLRTLRVSSLDHKQLVVGGYGGIAGVGQGSSRKPRLVKVTYTPAGGSTKPPVGLVGKGITFDTGGISLKQPANMELMTMDMTGAASVLGTVIAAARLELPILVTAYLCLAENMPGGNAYRPGDVLTMRNGKTVQVTNTDAEGRLVMADGLAAAISDGCEPVVDIATLTYAQRTALGDRTAAVMGTDDVRAELVAAADRAGENAWPMPIPDELRALLKSDVADLVNAKTDRAAGSSFAAAFLREFTDGKPWGHIDILGPAFNRERPYGYTPSGATGAGVRTLIQFLEEMANNR